MALTLPKAKSIKITATLTSGGNAEVFDVTTKVGQNIPTLQIPSILQLIRNTSVEPATSVTENTRYQAMTKASSVPLISAQNGLNGTLGQDPRTLTASDLDLIIAQFTPQVHGKKYQSLSWDNNIEGLGDMLAQKMASYISNRRTQKSFEAIDQMRKSAQVIQAGIVATTATATTFAKGAHVEKKDLATAEEAYTLFTNATTNFQRIGTPNAKEDVNKNYAHAYGIEKADMFVMMSPEFEALILGKQGVFASESGNALFREAGIKRLLGVDVTSSVTLPAGVHFIVVTTGMNGTYGYEDVDGGEKGNMLIDPNWSFAQRLDLMDAFTRGVVLPFQIFVAQTTTEADAVDPDGLVI